MIIYVELSWLMALPSCMLTSMDIGLALTKNHIVLLRVRVQMRRAIIIVSPDSKMAKHAHQMSNASLLCAFIKHVEANTPSLANSAQPISNANMDTTAMKIINAPNISKRMGIAPFINASMDIPV